MDLSALSPRERLIAEQAVETLRAVDKAADEAAHGEGLARMEAAVHERGFELLRRILASSAGARDEAQKRGSPAPAPARGAAGAGRRSSRPARSGRS